MSGTELTRQSDEEFFAGCGPAMRACTERERQFILALMVNGYNATRAAAEAGFNGDAGALAVTGNRLRHKPKIIAAMQEEALTRLNGDVLMATGTLARLANDPLTPAAVQAKCAIAILDRIPAFVVEHKQKVEVTHTNRSRDQEIEDVVRLCKIARLDPQKVLGSYGVTVDAEFREVEPAPPLPPIPGLEDCT